MLLLILARAERACWRLRHAGVACILWRPARLVTVRLATSEGSHLCKALRDLLTSGSHDYVLSSM